MSYTWAPRSIELDLSGGRPVALRHVLGQLGAPPAATALERPYWVGGRRRCLQGHLDALGRGRSLARGD